MAAAGEVAAAAAAAAAAEVDAVDAVLLRGPWPVRGGQATHYQRQ